MNGSEITMHPYWTRSRKPEGRSVSVVATTDGERVALTAFLSYAVLAGGNAVCIRFSNRELAPLWGASLRFALAAALLLAVMLMFKLAFPRGRGTGRVAALRAVQHWRRVRADLLRARPDPCRTRPNLAGTCTAGHALARGALVAGAPACGGGHGNPARSRGRRGGFSLSFAGGRAYAVGARGGWRRDLLRASFGAATTLPKRAPRDHECHRDDGGSCCASCSLTCRERADRVPAPPPDMGGHGLPGCDRLGGRLPAVLGRSPVLTASVGFRALELESHHRIIPDNPRVVSRFNHICVAG